MYKLPVIVVKLQGSRRQLKLNESTLALPYSTLTVVSRETESWASGLGLYMPDAQTTVRQRSSCDITRPASWLQDGWSRHSRRTECQCQPLAASQPSR